MTATTQPGTAPTTRSTEVTLDECIANLRGKMTYGDKPLETTINYLIRLREIEGKLREPTPEMCKAVIGHSVGPSDGCCPSPELCEYEAFEIFTTMSEVLLREKSCRE